MPIEYRNRDSEKGTKTVMTECNECGEEIPDGVGFAEHWQYDCPSNPLNQL